MVSDNLRPLTLSLQAAAQLIKVNPGTLRERAASGQIPGAKIGRAWSFIESDLLEYLRSQYPPCLSISNRTAKSGGSTSAMLGNGYVGALERQIAQRRNDAKKKSRPSYGR